MLKLMDPAARPQYKLAANPAAATHITPLRRHLEADAFIQEILLQNSR